MVKKKGNQEPVWKSKSSLQDYSTVRVSGWEEDIRKQEGSKKKRDDQSKRLPPLTEDKKYKRKHKEKSSKARKLSDEPVKHKRHRTKNAKKLSSSSDGESIGNLSDSDVSFWRKQKKLALWLLDDAPGSEDEKIIMRLKKKIMESKLYNVNLFIKATPSDSSSTRSNTESLESSSSSSSEESFSVSSQESPYSLQIEHRTKERDPFTYTEHVTSASSPSRYRNRDHGSRNRDEQNQRSYHESSRKKKKKSKNKSVDVVRSWPGESQEILGQSESSSKNEYPNMDNKNKNYSSSSSSSSSTSNRNYVPKNKSNRSSQVQHKNNAKVPQITDMETSKRDPSIQDLPSIQSYTNYSYSTSEVCDDNEAIGTQTRETHTNDRNETLSTADDTTLDTRVQRRSDTDERRESLRDSEEEPILRPKSGGRYETLTQNKVRLA